MILKLIVDDQLYELSVPEAFIAEANVNILTSLLFLRRKSEEEKRETDEHQHDGKLIV